MRSGTFLFCLYRPQEDFMNSNRTFARYISLSILGMLGSSGTILADTFFVSHRLGADGLAALNIAISVFGLINGLGMLLGVGGATRYTILRSQGQETRASQSFTLAFRAALGIGLCFWLAGLGGAGGIARALGANREILPLCTTYLKTVLCFAPFFVLNHLFMAFLRNDGAPQLAMAVMLTGSLANILLDYLFVYPLGLGIFGAALATGLAPVLGLLVASLHLWRGRNGFHLVPVRFRPAALARMAAPGLASFVNEFSSCVVLVVFNRLILGAEGNTGVAAYGIVANLALVVLAIFTGIAQGLQPLLSDTFGRGDTPQLARLCRRGQRLAGGLGLGFCALAWAAAPTLVGWFNSEQNPLLQSLAEEGLRIYFAGFLFVGANQLLAALLSTTGQARTAFGLSVFRGCVGITAAAALLGALFGMTGIWLAYPAVELVTLLLGRTRLAERSTARLPG